MKDPAEIFRLPRAAGRKVNSDKSSVIEGDGTAWDTTCSKALRERTENVILAYIGSWIKVSMLHPDAWVDAHQTAYELDEYHLKFRKDETWSTNTPAIKRNAWRFMGSYKWG